MFAIAMTDMSNKWSIIESRIAYLERAGQHLFAPSLQWGFEDLVQRMMPLLLNLVMYKPAIYSVLAAGDIGCII